MMRADFRRMTPGELKRWGARHGCACSPGAGLRLWRMKKPCPMPSGRFRGSVSWCNPGSAWAYAQRFEGEWRCRSGNPALVTWSRFGDYWCEAIDAH